MKIKKFALALTAFGAICASGYAIAGANHSEYSYYSDGTYTTQVGTRVITCWNSNTVTGTVTLYKRVDVRYSCYL